MTTVKPQASSFVTEVLATAGRLDGTDQDDLAAKLRRLSHKADGIKAEVFDLLQKKYKDYHPGVASAADLISRIHNFELESQGLINTVQSEVNSHLSKSSSTFNDLSIQLGEVSAINEIVNRLMKLDINLQESAGALKTANYKQAASSLLTVHQILSEFSRPRDGDLLILHVVRKAYIKQTAQLERDVSDAWNKLIKWTIKKENAGKKSLEGAITINEDGLDTDHVVTLLQALNDLKSLQLKLDLFGERLLDHVIHPIVTDPECALTVNDRSLSVEHHTLTPTTAQTTPCSVHLVVEMLMQVFTFLQKQLFSVGVVEHQGERSNRMMSKLGDHISNRLLSDYVIACCLQKSIPSSRAGLMEYTATTMCVQGFQSMLVEMDFIDESNTILSDFVNDISVLFANKKCEETLQTARLLMTSDMHQTVCFQAVEEDICLEGSTAKPDRGVRSTDASTESSMSPQTLKLPACTISLSTRRLMELARQTLAEATDTTSANIQFSVQQFYSVRDMFCLYCEVVPIYHKDLLESEPNMTAVHLNNCLYLAHHLLLLGHHFSSKLPSPLNEGAATFVDVVPKLRRLGTEVFLQQMRKQKQMLGEILSKSDGFGNVSEQDNYITAEGVLKQILYQLKKLSHFWKDVLPSHIYYKSIGSLINSALVEIINGITALEDLSTKDAVCLHKLLHPLVDNIHQLYDPSKQVSSGLIYVHVAAWSKLSELLLILTGGLQDIADRWADGKGPLSAQFSSNEIKQLIRAIFQNTEQRSRVLATIK